LNGHPDGPGWHLENQNSPVGVRHLFNKYQQMQPFQKPGLGPFQIFKSGGPHNLPGQSVRHPENHMPAALIGQRGAVTDQFLKIKAVSGLFEFQMLIFRRSCQPCFQLGEGDVHTASRMVDWVSVRLIFSPGATPGPKTYL
jgi:hypothetical protein